MSGLHRCQSSLLPKANKPYSNKEEGRNKAEKELAVADHFLIDIASEISKVTIDAISEVNVTRSILSRAGSECNVRGNAAGQRIRDGAAHLFR